MKNHITKTLTALLLSSLVNISYGNTPIVNKVNAIEIGNPTISLENEAEEIKAKYEALISDKQSEGQQKIERLQQATQEELNKILINAERQIGELLTKANKTANRVLPNKAIEQKIADIEIETGKLQYQIEVDYTQKIKEIEDEYIAEISEIEKQVITKLALLL